MKLIREALLIFIAAALLAQVALPYTAYGKEKPARRLPRTNFPVAPTPPMGWNSWDCYGPTVTEAEVKANADYMAQHLVSYGWKYIVVDIQWYEPHAQAHGYRPNAKLVTDDYGRLLPASNRFPSSAGGKGFKPLADYIHSKGLKFGIHIMRGIPRQAVRANQPVFASGVRAHDIADEQNICPWNTDMYGVRADTPGGQAYYDSILRLYADWGVDYIKADDMTAFNGKPADEARLAEIAALNRAIKKSGRPIVLSLSPGPASTEQAAFLQTHAQMWRIADDFWDRWEDLKKQFELTRKWSRYTTVNSFPDADMLPLGRIGIRAERGDNRRTRFTQDEQITLMTLWAIFRSPLMFGGDLPSNDAFTLSLLTNSEVLKVNQHSINNHELFARGNYVAWVADVPRSRDKYLAIFNLGDDAEAATIDVSLKEVGFNGKCAVRDLWQKKNLGSMQNELKAIVNRHGAQLYRLSPE
jgi:alpha-galactosidase